MGWMAALLPTAAMLAPTLPLAAAPANAAALNPIGASAIAAAGARAPASVTAATTAAAGLPLHHQLASRYCRVALITVLTSLPIKRYSQYGNRWLAAIAIAQPTTVSIARSPMMCRLPGASRWNISSTYDDVNTTLAA